MHAIVYKNTVTKTPNLGVPVHTENSRGFAYILDNFFVHLYGYSNGLWTISPGLTTTEQVNDTLENWAIKSFGASNIYDAKNSVGECISGVWRPGLYFQNELNQALEIDEHTQRADEQALRVLVNKLDELLLYIEPDKNGLSAYSHKSRELLILACTEIENTWKQYMLLSKTPAQRSNYTTNDYVKLNKPLFLTEFEVKIKPYKDIDPIRPFCKWSTSDPTRTLPWYDAYNKTKHDRKAHFNEATLLNCIHAIAGNIVLFCVRYSPYSLFRNSDTLSSVMNQLFEVNLIDPDPATFYLPKMILPDNRRKDLFCGLDRQPHEAIHPWKINPLQL